MTSKKVQSLSYPDLSFSYDIVSCWNWHVNCKGYIFLYEYIRYTYKACVCLLVYCSIDSYVLVYMYWLVRFITNSIWSSDYVKLSVHILEIAILRKPSSKLPIITSKIPNATSTRGIEGGWCLGLNSCQKALVQWFGQCHACAMFWGAFLASKWFTPWVRRLPKNLQFKFGYIFKKNPPNKTFLCLPPGGAGIQF